MRVSCTILALVFASLFYSSVCVAQQQSASAASSQKPTGTITGRVINSDGERLVGATVYANGVGSNLRRQSATTDTNGDFKIERLDAGLYQLTAAMPGYVPLFLMRSNESPNYYRIGDSVTLTLFKGGVITGTVAGPDGPLIAAGVFATRVRDEAGKKLASPIGFNERQTDDRGVFRFYGLPPGGYLLSAGKPRIGLLAPTAYDAYAPTYFPSATRDNASEILVHEGDEVTADIQFRAATGYIVSGKVAGVFVPEIGFAQGATLALTNVRNRTEITTTGTTNEDSGFAFYGVPEGEYEVVASQYLQSRDELKSAPRRVTVRGADVNGIDLTLAQQASIEGRIIFEHDPKAACATRRETAAQETLVYVRQFESKGAPPAETEAAEPPPAPANYASLAVGDAKGSFIFRNLPPGSYVIDPVAPASGWYARSVAIASASLRAPRTAVGSSLGEGISVKSGERISGVTITIAEGAAKLRGKITLAEGQSLSANLRVYMIPAERENADNVLRFYEARPDADRSFTIDNVAPGRYLIVARLREENDLGTAKVIRQDGTFRAKVVHDAEALKKDVVFKPCEQLADYQLPYSPPTSQQ